MNLAFFMLTEVTNCVLPGAAVANLTESGFSVAVSLSEIFTSVAKGKVFGSGVHQPEYSTMSFVFVVGYDVNQFAQNALLASDLGKTNPLGGLIEIGQSS